MDTNYESSNSTDTYHSVAQKSRLGFYWLATGTVATYIVRLISSIILARILFPSDYGLMSMAVAFAGMASAFGNFGIGAALVQEKRADGPYLNAAFSLNLLGGLLIGVAQYSLAPLGVKFYGVPEVGDIMRVMALSYPLTALFSIHSSHLRKQLCFHHISLIEFCKQIVSSFGMILFAIKGFGVWSFVVPPLVVKGLSVPVYWIVSSYTPILSLDDVKKHYREIFHFGKFATGNSILNYVVKNADYLLIGRLLSPSLLGLYSFAYGNSMLLSRFILTLVNNVSFPAFSLLKEKMDEMLKAYLKILQVITFFSFPSIIFAMLHAGLIIETVFGPRWHGAVFPFQFICIYALVNSVTSSSGSFLYAISRPDVNFKIILATIPFLLIGMFLGVKAYGIIGCAAAIALIQSISSICKIYINFRVAKWKFALLWGAIRKNLIFSLLAAGGSYFVHVSFASLNDIALLAILAIAFFASFLLLKVWFDRKGLALFWGVVLTPDLSGFLARHIPQWLRVSLCLSTSKEGAR